MKRIKWIDPNIDICIAVVCMILVSCSHNSSRIEEMEAKIASMNQSLESMTNHSERQIAKRQEMLQIIQSELNRIDTTAPTVDASPAIEAAPILDNAAIGIQSVPMTEPSNSIEGSKNSQTNVNAFVQAMTLYEQKQYAEASALFHQIYLNTETVSSVREESLYKTGECYYLIQDWNRTIERQLQFVQEYPQSDQVPKALLQTGLSYQYLNQSERAKVVFQYLSRHYPNSEESRKIPQQ